MTYVLSFRRMLCVLVLVAVPVVGTNMHAQAVLLRRDAPEPEYVLGEGDQIVIHVADLDEIPTTPIRIDPNGCIDVPLAGRVEAAGKTPTQLKNDLSAKLSKYITNPEITINVTENQSRPVSIFGSVTHAGVYQISGPQHLAEVLSLAGGTSPDAGPMVVVTRQSKWGEVSEPGMKTVLSSNTSSITIPLEDITSAKHPEANILIRPNDVISVPKADVVYVVGNVKRAGGFPLTHENSSVLQAIALAEGFSPDAAPNRARILRRSPEGDQVPPKEIIVDAHKIMDGKAPDVPLYANDILFIPNSALKASSKRAIEATIGIASGMMIYR